MTIANRVGCLVSVLLLGFVVASFSASQVEGSQTMSKREHLERYLTKLKNDGGFPVKRVVCLRYEDKVRPWMLWQCRIVYRFGPPDYVRTSQMVPGGPYVMWYYRAAPPAGAWYRDCLRTESKSYCRRIGRKQILACMDRPSDYRECREIAYGHALEGRARD